MCKIWTWLFWHQNNSLFYKILFISSETICEMDRSDNGINQGHRYYLVSYRWVTLCVSLCYGWMWLSYWIVWVFMAQGGSVICIFMVLPYSFVSTIGSHLAVLHCLFLTSLCVTCFIQPVCMQWFKQQWMFPKRKMHVSDLFSPSQ